MRLCSGLSGDYLLDRPLYYALLFILGYASAWSENKNYVPVDEIEQPQMINAPEAVPALISVGAHQEISSSDLADRPTWNLYPAIKFNLFQMGSFRLGYSENNISQNTPNASAEEHKFYTSLSYKPLFFLGNPKSETYLGTTWIQKKILRNSQYGDESRREYGFHVGSSHTFMSSFTIQAEVEYRIISPYRIDGDEKKTAQAQLWQFHIDTYFGLF